MKILVLGLGVIGTLYGYVCKQAGHTVEHLPREGKAYPEKLSVRLMDGRTDPAGVWTQGSYEVRRAQMGGAYDLILVSVPGGQLAQALSTLRQRGVPGPLLLFCGLWEPRAHWEGLLSGWDWLMGYPVAGGNRAGGTLTGALFDHVMLEGPGRSPAQPRVIQLLHSAGLKAEIPYDMLEWIWLHMAVNAGVIATAGKWGDVRYPAKAAQSLMDCSKALAEAVRCIRQTARIVAARGVKLSHYAGELLPYLAPSPLAGVVMKRMFRSNELTRNIMTLHSNPQDLLYVCRSLYACGKALGVSAPLYFRNYEAIDKALEAVGGARGV